jgi:hypothetical protein
MGSLVQIIKLLPEIIALLNSIQKAIDQAETDRKVSDDLKAIKAAFDSKDASALNHIFNN